MNQRRVRVLSTLPDTLDEGLDSITKRLAQHGLVVISDTTDGVRTMQPAARDV